MALTGKSFSGLIVDEFDDKTGLFKHVGEIFGAPRGGFTHFWLDEWSSFSKDIFKLDLDCVATFEDERVPDATVKIYEKGFDKHDPRHPNPAAGHRSTKAYTLKCGDRQIGAPFGNLQAAKMKAKTLHERMVEEVLALRREQELEKLASQASNPKFGMF
jgi:hypothetical protein